MKKLVILFLVLLLGLSAGFVTGARLGSYEHMIADAQYKASILAFQLRALKAGKPEPVITGMEISLNAELANHGRYMESRFALLWPELRSSDEKAIRHAVAYRIANPYEMPDHSKPENWNPGIDMNSEFVKDTLEGQRILDHYLAKVLKHYAPAAAHNNSLQPTPKSGAAELVR